MKTFVEHTKTLLAQKDLQLRDLSAPLPYAISDKEAFKLSLPDDLKQLIVAEGEKYLDYTFPAIPASLFLDFSRTGNRTRFEDVYFAKRRALNALICAELTEDLGRFTDKITDGLYSICEESAWQLPAHNSYIRDEKQYPLPDVERPVLDLFACETGALLATAIVSLKEKLDAVSPFIYSNIRNVLITRIITPYTASHFWWMGNGDEPMCNWTVWCTQNILLTAFRLGLDDATKKQILSQAAYSIDAFLKDYGEDGCCEEGAQYYRHAGLCLGLTLMLLNEISDNAYSDFCHEPKIRNIAEYISHMHISGEYYINFADCAAKPGAAGIREFLFGKIIHSEELCSFAAESYISHMHRAEYRLLADEINLTYRLLSYAGECTLVSSHNAKDSSLIPEISRKWYESVGLYIIKKGKDCLAVKMGDNGDSHNHNDTGSFILYYDGSPVFIDAGVESYTRKTFSPDRYEIWTMQSSFHNLPVLNGFDEKDGAEYKAAEISLSENGISADIHTAYPANSGVARYERSFTCDGDTFGIRLSDHAEFTSKSKNTVLNFLTYEIPVFNGDKANPVITVGNVAEMKVTTGITNVKIEEIPITDPRLQLSWEHSLYRVQLETESCDFEVSIEKKLHSLDIL